MFTVEWFETSLMVDEMTVTRGIFRHIAAFTIVFAVLTRICSPSRADERPNVVLIYADDLGLGDVSCYGAKSVSTPNIDRLAKEGIQFTDAHSAAATCTPSRFAMMTGTYAWRQQGTGIAAGDAALIIEPGSTNLASIFQEAGYKSSVVGKWHLGLGAGQLDWNGKIAPGPLELGFDECFLVPATGDRVPTVYVENHHVFNLDPADPITVSFKEPVGDEPTGADNPELLRQKFSHGHNQTIHNGISRIGYMSGGRSARWVDEDMADTLTARACDFIDRHANEKQPFFLFFSLHDIHVPRTPHARFVGSTPMGPRGDAIAQADWCVGEVLKRLDSLGVADNTLVIFTSDNGPVLDDGYRDDAVEKLGKHDPAGGYRGGKYSAFEAGTRVPMIVRWPAKIPAGKVSPAIMCQIDYCALMASLAGITLRPYECQDSREHIPSLLGQDDYGRWFLVEQSKTLSLRHGNWKYIEPAEGPAIFPFTKIESGLAPIPQLYDLEKDKGERNNVATQFPEKVKEYQTILKGIREETRARQ
jgi:arylsulfatase A-like enzyme